MRRIAAACSSMLQEELLLQEAHARHAVSRSAGLKPATFIVSRTMEDLFLEVFRRRAEEGLRVLARRRWRRLARCGP